MPRRRWHRAVFIAAGLYNLVFGVVAVLWPQAFFNLAGFAPINHPAVFQCLGMVVGLYGVLYLEVARVPERGWLIAAVGLTGKILGPIGMIALIAQGEWPIRAGRLCLGNDLIWWIPFALYLHDAWPAYRRGIILPAESEDTERRTSDY